MVPCIFKKKVNHALSGSVFQTICGKFGNSNCTAVGLLYSTSHSSAAAARKPICMLSIHIFLFANKKVGFFSILQPKMKSKRMNCASEEPVRLRFWPSFQADKHFFRRPVLPWDDVCHASKDESHISTKEHP